GARGVEEGGGVMTENEVGPDEFDASESPEEIERIRMLIAEGLASGFCKEEPKEILRQIIAERRARHG
ncbi:MAG: hypothetical protein ABIU18_03145, partial [Novosphingobium sp.]